MTKFLTRIAWPIAVVVGVIEASSPTNDSLSRVPVVFHFSRKDDPEFREEPKRREVRWDKSTTFENVEKEFSGKTDDAPIFLVLKDFDFFEGLTDKSDDEKEKVLSPVFGKVTQFKLERTPPRPSGGVWWSPSRTQRFLASADHL